jgi:hypothetical protein
MSTLMKHLDMNVIAGHVISFFNRIDLDQNFTMATFNFDSIFCSSTMASASIQVSKRRGCKRESAKEKSIRGN